MVGDGLRAGLGRPDFQHLAGQELRDVPDLGGNRLGLFALLALEPFRIVLQAQRARRAAGQDRLVPAQ